MGLESQAQEQAEAFNGDDNQKNDEHDGTDSIRYLFKSTAPPVKPSDPHGRGVPFLSWICPRDSQPLADGFESITLKLEEIGVSNETGEYMADIVGTGDGVGLADEKRGGECGSMWTVDELGGPNSARMRYQ